MRNTSFTLRWVSALALVSLWMAPPLAAQQRDTQQRDAQPREAWGTHVTAIATISVQPKGPAGQPYLDRGLGATRPGLTVGFGVEKAKSPYIASVELSTTAAMETTQRGRFIVGFGPTVARHRDTLLSILPGVRWHVGSATMEAKGGVSFRFGEPTWDGEPVSDVYEEFSGGSFAVTTGFDAVLPIKDRISLIPSFRYSMLDRGNDINYVGLGDRITRVGVGLRFKLGN